jgi:hypothetical protein
VSRSYLRRNRIGGQFSARTIEMLESPAYRVLSLAAHRVLSRIEIEHAHHGGRDNGKLPVTFGQFVEYGIPRKRIAPAIREIVALGFVEVTKQGRAGNGEWRWPNEFRLTYRPVDRAKPTDEWGHITEDDAARISHQIGPRKTKHQCPFRPPTGAQRGYRKSKTPVPNGGTTVPVPNGGTTSRLSGWGVGEAAAV